MKQKIISGLVIGIVMSITSPLYAGALVFLSDFGLKDASVSAMKGVAVSVDPALRIYDVTNEITSFNIWEGSYRLAQAAPYWPAETVFVAVVDPGVGTDRDAIVLKTKNNQYVVAPDNGLVTSIAENMGISEVRLIDSKTGSRPGAEVSKTFHGRDIFAYTGAQLASGKVPFKKIGPVLEKSVIMIAHSKPAIDNNTLTGGIPVLDAQYGNVWTDIPEKMVAACGITQGKSLDIKIAAGGVVHYQGVLPFVATFGDVPNKTGLAYINSLMMLSFALNMDNFAEKYGILSGPEWTVEVKISEK